VNLGPLHFLRHRGLRQTGRRKIAVLLLALQILSVDHLEGATVSGREYLIDVWETEQGLPENSATAMVQTGDGYIWFGTFNGLVRFDGVKFHVFNPSNTPELPDAGIVNLHLDAGQRLWISTYRGLATWHNRQWAPYGPAQGWTGDFVRTFSENAGVLCITSFDGKVFRCDGASLQELPEPPGNKGRGYFGHVDSNGMIWVVQDGFFGSWNGQKWTSSNLANEVRNGFQGAVTGRDGSLLVLNSNGLQRLKDADIQEHRKLPEEIREVWSLTEDHEGNVWIGTTHSGMYKVSSRGEMSHYSSTNGLSYDAVRFIFEDRERNIWVGGSGGGLSRLKPRAVMSYGLESGLPERIVKAVAEESPGKILIGTYGNGLARLENERIQQIYPWLPPSQPDYTQCLMVDRAGNTWWEPSDSGSESPQARTSETLH